MASPFGPQDLFVSPSGNDLWTGSLAEPNADRTDGPLATLNVARALVRERRAKAMISGHLTVWIRGGRYATTKPIIFEPADSAPVTYAAYPGEQPVLDGGVRIKSWRTQKVNGVDAWVTDVSDLLKKRGDFRQLFVNGQRRSRTRLPEKDYYWMEDVPGLPLDAFFEESTFVANCTTFKAAKGDIQIWKNLQDVEVLAMHLWTEERMPIASYDPETRMVQCSRKSIYGLTDDIGNRYAKYFVENVFEALKHPGQWYLDKHEAKLYYVPMRGETPENTEVVAPVLLQFIRMQGDPEAGQFIEFIGFRGLSFEYTDWVQPNWVGVQFNPYAQQPAMENETSNMMDGNPWKNIPFASGGQGASNVPGVIYMEGCRNCAIEDCRIEHVGWYGIEMYQGCCGNRVIGNTIADMGAGGVKINGTLAEDRWRGRTKNNRITDNHIHHGGEVFASGTGVIIQHGSGNWVAHNHIHDLYQIGISLGWVWGYGFNVCRENRVEKNHIHHLGKGVLSDMGGIYTLGVQPGTTIRGNLVHDIQRCNYGGWGIYPDEGSSSIVIENNICYNTGSQTFHQHFGRENVVRNNIWAFGQEGMAALSRGNRHNRRYTHVGQNIQCAVTFERNIFITNGEPIFVGSLADATGNLERGDIISDLNLFFDTTGQEIVSGNGIHGKHGRENLKRAFNWKDWQALGYDLHSAVADPKCRDLAKYDFTLAPDSPALKLGFKPIDMSDVGIRPPEKRVEEPDFQARRWDV